MVRKHTVAAIVAAVGVAAMFGVSGANADVVFSDNFSTSTLNSATPGTPTASSTDYQLISSKSWSPTPSIAANDMKFGIAATTGGTIEAQALFTSSPITLATAGDYVELTFTFTDTSGIINQAGTLCYGLYNGNQVQPLAGGLNGTALSTATSGATGGAQNWKGYVGRVAYTGGTTRIANRDAQTGTGANNQDLLTEGSSSQSYRNPAGTAIATATSSLSSITAGNVYTADLKITLLATGDLQIDSNLYDGAGTGGSNLSTQTGTATGAALLSNTYTYDGLAIGWRAQANTYATQMDLSSITVSSNVTAVPEPASLGLLAVGGLGLLARRRRA